jgi:hypothetical protein
VTEWKDMRIYKYVFYKIYRLERVLCDPAPEYTALFGMLVVQGLNLGLLAALIQWFTGAQLPYLGRLELVYLLVILGLPQYFLFVHRGKFKGIAERFATESSRQSLLGGCAVALYVVFSFVLFMWGTSLVHG